MASTPQDFSRWISIHPPRVGRDPTSSGPGSPRPHFNPPSPCGEGPGDSLHSRTGKHFNPPSPCGEGPIFHTPNINQKLFQSTLPVWGGT